MENSSLSLAKLILAPQDTQPRWRRRRRRRRAAPRHRAPLAARDPRWTPPAPPDVGPVLAPHSGAARRGRGHHRVGLWRSRQSAEPGARSAPSRMPRGSGVVDGARHRIRTRRLAPVVARPRRRAPPRRPGPPPRAQGSRRRPSFR